MWKFIWNIICVLVIILCFRDAAIAYQASKLWEFGIDLTLVLLIFKDLEI